MKVKTCCCCLSLEAGAIIIGVLQCVAMVTLFSNFLWPRFIILAISILFFLNMVVNDNEKHRKWFFIVYVVCCICSLIYVHFYRYELISESGLVEEICSMAMKRQEETEKPKTSY